MDISGTAALVTGASRGLGEALALELAERGAKVVLVGRARRTLEPIVQRIVARGGEAHALEAELGDQRDVYPLAGAASALVGRFFGSFSRHRKMTRSTIGSMS